MWQPAPSSLSYSCDLKGDRRVHRSSAVFTKYPLSHTINNSLISANTSALLLPFDRLWAQSVGIKGSSDIVNSSWASVACEAWNIETYATYSTVTPPAVDPWIIWLSNLIVKSCLHFVASSLKLWTTTKRCFFLVFFCDLKEPEQRNNNGIHKHSPLWWKQ